MNYHNITTADMKNGDGLRVVLWVAGCAHRCDGCQNPVTWDPFDGLPFSDVILQEEIFKELDKDYISGITFSGGDPLHPANRQEIARISEIVKDRYPNKTIWMYTGYTWEEIMQYPILVASVSQVDVLVDGRFKKDLLDVNYPWAGSTNQRVIDVQRSLNEGAVILHECDQERRYAGTIRPEQNCGCCK